MYLLYSYFSQLCVCLFCVCMSLNRLADHFGGKLHMGFVQIREKIESLEVSNGREKRKGKRKCCLLYLGSYCEKEGKI